MKKNPNYILSAIKIVFISAFTVLLLAAAGIFVVLKWPQTLFNPKVIGGLVTLSSKFGIVVRWDQAQFKIDSFGLLHKAIDFKFTNLCFNLGGNQTAGCFKKLELAGEFSTNLRGFRIISLGPVIVEQGSLAIHQKKVEEKVDELFGYDLPDLVLPEYLHSTSFKSPIQIGLDRVSIWEEGEILLLGALALQPTINGQGEIEKVDAKINLAPGYDTPSGLTEGTFTSASRFKKNDWRLQVNSHLKTESGDSLQAKLSAYQTRSGTYDFQGVANYKKGKIDSTANLKGMLGRGKLQVNASGKLQGLSPELNSMSFSNCKLVANQPSATSKKIKLGLDCPIVFDLKNLRLPDAAYEKYVQIPLHAKTNLKVDLNTELFPSLDKPVDGKATLHFDTISEELFSFKGDAETEFAGIPKKYPQGWKLETDADVSLLLKQFKKLVRLLDKSAFAIPAPLRVLDGTVEFKLKGKMNIVENRGTIPIEFNTELQSTRQKFNTQGEGELTYHFGKSGSESNIDMELNLTNLRLELPKFGYDSIPTLLPDKRMIDPNRSTSRESKFNYHIKIKTPADHPAQVFSNFAKEYIPVSLDLVLTPQKIGGEVSIQNAQLVFFRRNALVKRMKFNFEEPIEKSVINSDIQINYANYNINILLIGSVNRPQIIFESSPPLDREQIISVLIYGRTYEELNTSQSNTVGSVSGAAADRVMTLGSLFLLAGSPIQSVSYNPATGAMEARVRVAEGTSIKLGTQEGKTQEAGLQQSLGGNWNLNTFFENDTETGKQRGGGMLEWYKRY